MVKVPAAASPAAAKGRRRAGAAANADTARSPAPSPRAGGATKPASGIRGRRLSEKVRRAQLIAEAQALFNARPYEEVKVEEIAAAAGVSEALVFHYFPTKRELYVAAFTATSAELGTVYEPDPNLPALEQLRAGLDAFLALVEAHAEAYRSLHQGGIGTDPEVRAIRDRTTAQRVTGIVELITAGAEAPEELRLAVHGWLGFIESACLEWLKRRRLPRAELRDLFVQMLIAATLSAWPQEDRPPEARIELRAEL